SRRAGRELFDWCDGFVLRRVVLGVGGFVQRFCVGALRLPGAGVAVALQRAVAAALPRGGRAPAGRSGLCGSRRPVARLPVRRGGAHAACVAKTPPEESTRDGFGAEDRDGAARKGLGWWDGMIGPGKAFDTDTFFVVSTNLLGGFRGTTGPSSADPATGQPY